MSTKVNKSEYPLYTGLVTPQWKETFQKYFQILIKEFYQFLNFPKPANMKVTQQKLKKGYNI
jgi:hypothetical protein